ncbi:phosphoglycerate kinase, partial [Rothia aeria]|nr:phosphoglycerate kinase [Rothia aeria]
MSHLGRPKGQVNEQFSLKNIVPKIEEVFGKKVIFSKDTVGEDAQQKVAALQNGEILLLENVRFQAEEEKGDREFAEKLSKFGDIYV